MQVNLLYASFGLLLLLLEKYSEQVNSFSVCRHLKSFRRLNDSDTHTNTLTHMQ